MKLSLLVLTVTLTMSMPADLAMAPPDSNLAAITIPACLILFGSGLIGLAGIARRRYRA